MQPLALNKALPLEPGRLVVMTTRDDEGQHIMGRSRRAS